MNKIARSIHNLAPFIGAAGELAYAPGHTFCRDAGFPHFTLECMLEGTATLTLGSAVYSRPAVNLSLIPPNTPYRLEMKSPHRALWLIFDPRPEWRGYLDWGLAALHPAKYPFLSLPQAPETGRILACLRQAIAYFDASGANTARKAELAFELALIHISELASSENMPDERLAYVVERMRRDAAHAWSEAELAAMANLSVSGFAHLFRKIMGVPPKWFLEQVRMEQAKNLLLSSNHSIKKVASTVGYPNPLHFSTRFRHRMGCSPQTFRKTGFTR